MTFSPLDSALYGDLFATAEMRAVFEDRRRLRAMLQVEIALARAEAALGIVPAELAARLAAIDPDALDIAAIGRLTADAGVPTIPFVKAVGALLPPSAEAHFHRGATSQDLADTALVLQMREALELLAADGDATLGALARLAVRHRGDPCAGRTTTQHAAVVTFGYKAAVWANGLAEVLARMPAIRASLLVASLGGAVGTLSVIGEKGPALLDAFARELGLGTPVVAWHTQRVRIAEAGAWLGLLLGALAKMAADILDLASTEVMEVSEPPAPGRGGSSAMPHKRNPVGATVIAANHAAAIGQVATLLGALASAHERPAGPWHAEWHALPALFGFASGALREARRLAEGLEVDAARMRRNLDLTHGLLFAEAASAALSGRLGRDAAQALVQAAAERVRRDGCTLRDALLSDPALSAAALRDAVEAAFDPGPAIRAAANWVDRVAADCEGLRARLGAPAQDASAAGGEAE
ncbi:class-II fumarase/aspartase family protein [Propylenella binzhouense]|uniref:Adenylosuccinate lyase family protein n=1 Tax=Propylenella binzhouense TaxID=2555902 RepID=A0A964T8D8_9HYPH|nr:adenylosuccinate lyase family protein [Propylenella binzhouense]MYZ49960.1 adenylosuccinate lyase family protein [Propylenella binzhouense]